MNWRRVGFMLLAVAALLAVLRILRSANVDEVSSGMADPAIKGLEIDSVDRLSRFVINTVLTTGWHISCDEGFFSPLQCTERRNSGFSPLQKAAAAVGDAVAIHNAMTHAGFMPLHPNAKPGDNLIVRVADEKMWVDFVGKDLAGRELMVSIALDSEGGTPVQLIAKLGTASKVVALAGARRKTNDRATIFLVPRAGEQNPRVGTWLYMPDENHPSTLKELAEVLPDTDPAFVPRVIKAIIASTSTADRPEESLGLYGALQSIEHRADILRLAHADLWLPKDQGKQLVKDAYQDDPVTRAAWALAMCESTADPAVIDADCWQRLMHADSNATALLRNEVAELQILYAPLEPTHPLRLRLKRLSDALSSS